MPDPRRVTPITSNIPLFSRMDDAPISAMFDRSNPLDHVHITMTRPPEPIRAAALSALAPQTGSTDLESPPAALGTPNPATACCAEDQQATLLCIAQLGVAVTFIGILWSMAPV